MENLKEEKVLFEESFNSLPQERQEEILKYYSIGGVNSLMAKAKREAQGVMDYADKKGYGYGEVGYHLDEEITEFAEETPELKSNYNSLLNAYFDVLTEASEI